MKIEEVKKHMARNIKVDYDGSKYTINACILKIIKGEWSYQLELKDLRVNSVLIVPMERVESKLDS